ncbi:MAG TPA: GNAT family N-acetyltransferase [Jatrophihabitans sp.]|nr:GNAT family N-acetyltransferase [Jatrophihabitans sp.]
MSSVLRRRVMRVEQLTDAARPALERLVDADPLVNVVLAARLRQVSTIERASFGGELLGVWDADRELVAAVLSAGNVLPIGDDPEAWQLLGANLATTPRACTSIVGRAGAVAEIWRCIGSAWGPARAIREAQPLLVADRSTVLPPGDARVRRIRPSELDQYLPAAAAMFTEELGVSPYRQASIAAYRRRVGGLINEGRAFGIVDRDGDVIFKADLGAVSRNTCQVQGVWVRPDERGKGIGTRALAAVFRHALALTPTVSLYVNDFNLAARKIYGRLGMHEAATLSTILF